MNYKPSLAYLLSQLNIPPSVHANLINLNGRQVCLQPLVMYQANCDRSGHYKHSILGRTAVFFHAHIHTNTGHIGKAAVIAVLHVWISSHLTTDTSGVYCQGKFIFIYQSMHHCVFKFWWSSVLFWIEIRQLKGF